MKHITFPAGAAAWLLATSPALFAEEAIPKATEFARYEPMMNRSPFAVATAVAAPVVAPNFAKDLYIANAARSPDGDLVTVASSTDKNFKKYLTTREPVEGFSISSIEWSERVGETKVTISKDGQFATLTFNQALLSAPIANSQPQVPQPVLNSQPQVMPQPMQPVPVMTPTAGFGQPVTNQPIKPAPIPMLPTPPARTRTVIQRNPSAPPPAPTPEVEL